MIGTVYKTHELPHACRGCRYQELTTGGVELVAVGAYCIVHGSGCRTCQARGELPTNGRGGVRTRICPDCRGLRRRKL